MYQMESIDKILDTGIALSKEKDRNKLLDMILDKSMEIANCDGGTLYILRNKELHFHVMKTLSMNVDKGKNGEVISLPPVPLKEENICAYSAIHKKVLNIKDVYANEEFDFSGPRNYDRMTGYYTQTMLAIPLLNQEEEVVGVLQLINAMDEEGNRIFFDKRFERVILALASQAAIAITNIHYLEEIKDQMWSFTEAMAEAIDSRTPYNANHVRKVALYAEKMADYINKLHEEGKEEEYFDTNRRERLVLAALFHDIGKLAIPLSIMNKATRLEDRINNIKTRFEIIGLKYQILFMKNVISEQEYSDKRTQLDGIWNFVNEINKSEFLPDDKNEKLQEIFQLSYCYKDERIPYFTQEEQEALQIKRGTLSDTERRIMESHVEVTERILSKVHFYNNLKQAAQFAVEHHECLNGTGYPKKLTGEQLVLESRILAVVDIYDALAATDRPYKKPLTREKCFIILHDMADSGRIDKKLVQYLEECV